MKRFLLQILVFSAPILLFLAVPTYILWNSGESFHSINKLVSEKSNYLIGYTYFENKTGYLKWKHIQSQEKKEVLALGSSRILQFREKMFEASFYNAGFTITSVVDFEPFLRGLPKTKWPAFLLISLDQWMFNSAYDSLANVPKTDAWEKNFSFFPSLFPVYKTIYLDLKAKKLRQKAIENEPKDVIRIGLNAQLNWTGFRNDGSMFYGSQISKLLRRDSSAADFNFSETFKRIQNGNRRFEFGQKVNQKAIFELEKFLAFCKQEGIEVIAFLPPFAESVCQKMEQSGNYAYMGKIMPALKPVFEKRGFELYDFTNIKSCGSTDSEAIDGFHGGEVTYLKILISMLQSGSSLNKVCKLKKLESDLKQRKNNFLVYDF